MTKRIDGDLRHWTTRITLRSSVIDAVQVLAYAEARSAASMIGVLLNEAIAARSSA